jgi:predicted Rossmann-fold nucleotide-binding protein
MKTSLAVERTLKERGIHRSLAVMGSSLITPKNHPLGHYHAMAEDFAYRWSDFCIQEKLPYCLCTGGGPGIMEAAHRGAERAGSFSFSLSLAREGSFLENSARHRRFFVSHVAQRKYLLWRWSMAAIFFPGGLGTLDELCDFLEKRSAGELDPSFSIILLGSDFWKSALSFETCLRCGTIMPKHLEFLRYVDSQEELLDDMMYVTQQCAHSYAQRGTDM